MKHLRAALALLALLSSIAHADVQDTPSERAFSLSAGSPALVVPRSDWTISREQRRPGDTAVYYMLSSANTQMFLSTYIDKSDACRSADDCLREALKNKSYVDAKEQKTFDLPSFKVASFYLDNPMGTPFKQAHILAAAYVEGVWFDIHISKAGTERPDLAPLMELLKSLSIR